MKKYQHCHHLELAITDGVTCVFIPNFFSNTLLKLYTLTRTTLKSLYVFSSGYYSLNLTLGRIVFFFFHPLVHSTNGWARPKLRTPFGSPTWEEGTQFLEVSLGCVQGAYQQKTTVLLNLCLPKNSI